MKWRATAILLYWCRRLTPHDCTPFVWPLSLILDLSGNAEAGRRREGRNAGGEATSSTHPPFRPRIFNAQLHIQDSKPLSPLHHHIAARLPHALPHSYSPTVVFVRMPISLSVTRSAVHVMRGTAPPIPQIRHTPSPPPPLPFQSSSLIMAPPPFSLLDGLLVWA